MNRKIPVMMSPPGARIIVDGETYDYFGGTGYLGLQGHAEVIDAACRAAETFGVHTATSRSRFASQSVLNVERNAAEVFGTESAFYFVSGYVGPALVVQSLRDSVDAIFIDAATHYSGFDAARALGVPVHPFENRDPGSLRTQLRQHLGRRQRPLVMTDGVFPSFGWIAPVDRYVEVLDELKISGAAVLVDDCHGFGTLGENGRGTLEHLGLWNDVNTTVEPTDSVRLFVVGTLSKAFGGFGGILPGSTAFVDTAVSSTHYFDGASGPPAPSAAASARALQIVRADPRLRSTLTRNVGRVRSGLRAIGIDNEDLPTPIVGFTHGDRAAMTALAKVLMDQGVIVPYAGRYSGVGPEGAMRLAVFATHTDDMIDRMLAAVQRAT